jgi:predicted lipid-binding transport protein (Tim44 family)
VEAAKQRSSQKMQQAASKVYLNSLGRVADDYIPSSSLTGMGRRAKSELTNRMAESKIKSSLSDFTAKAFLAEATTIYERFQKALASHDVSEMRELVAPAMLTKTKAVLEQRPAAAEGLKTEWEGRVTGSKILTMRYIPVDELALNFAHIAVRFDTVQRLRLVKAATGEVVKETGEKQLDDTWVFERVVNKRDERWRYLDSLPLPEGEISLIEENEKRQAQEKVDKAAAAAREKAAKKAQAKT